MKEHTKGVVTGVLTTCLILGITTTALAATGAMTITVDPINIQVNGATFQPKDAQGNAVPVFAYNGTTYAPLRALAEAYGLEVGYDAQTNMATVTGDVAAPGGTTPPAPDTTASVADYSDWSVEEEAAYQEFKGMWKIEVNKHVDGVGTSYTAEYSGNLANEDLRSFLLKMGDDKFSSYGVRLLDEQSNNIEETETMMFWSKEQESVIARADIIWGGTVKDAFFVKSFKNG